MKRASTNNTLLSGPCPTIPTAIDVIERTSEALPDQYSSIAGVLPHKHTRFIGKTCECFSQGLLWHLSRDILPAVLEREQLAVLSQDAGYA